VAILIRCSCGLEYPDLTGLPLTRGRCSGSRELAGFILDLEEPTEHGDDAILVFPSSGGLPCLDEDGHHLAVVRSGK